jgi:hypothetical protein
MSPGGLVRLYSSSARSQRNDTSFTRRPNTAFAM